MDKARAEQIISNPSSADSYDELKKAININLDSEDEFFLRRAKEVVTAKAIVNLIVSSNRKELGPILLILLKGSNFKYMKKEDNEKYVLMLIEEIANILQNFTENELIFITETCIEASR